jgi:hypothetical protein
MKSANSIKKQLSKPSEQDIENLRNLKNLIDMIISQKVINEETLKNLSNILTTAGALKENYMWRLLKAAKQNHMID